MLRTQAVWTGVAGTPWYSTLYFFGGSEEAEDAHDATTAFYSAFVGGCTTLVTQEYDGSVTQMSDDGTIETVYSYSPSSNGGLNTSDPLPFATQLLITLRTNFYVPRTGGGSYRVQGRFNVPGLCENALTAGVFPVGTTAPVQAAVDALIASPSTLVVWSPTQAETYMVASATAQSKPAVLRSRRD